MATNTFTTLKPLSLANVRLTGGPFYDAAQINVEHLKAIDIDRLLVPFRREACIATDAEPYQGWELRSINGHSLGHYLSAVSLLYASTGEAWAKLRVERIVTALAECQTAMGDGAVLPVPRSAYDDLRAGRIDATPFELNGVWVPNYTLHKLFAGLRDAYRYVDLDEALRVEVNLAGWLKCCLEGLDDKQVQTMLSAEHGGMLEVYADLAIDTGDLEYAAYAERFWFHREVLDPLLQGIDVLDGKHGNTQIPKVLGLAKLYEVTGKPKYRDAVEFFWQQVVVHRSYANGGHGEAEHFFPIEQFPDRLTPMTAETCNTYNLMKLTGHVFAWNGNADAMDFAERALLNHLLANIGRRPGEFGYFLGLGSVGVKVFSESCQAWWCCVGTGMENPARYAEQAYAVDDESWWVNLYLNSTATWQERGLTLRQETEFPCGDRVRLSFSGAGRFALKLRHPAWCVKVGVLLNGKAVVAESMPGNYLTISRDWQDGDTVEVHLPMSLRAEPLPQSDGKVVALMHGPNLLAAVLEPEIGVPDPAKRRFAEHLDARGKTDAVPPVVVAENVDDLLSKIKPLEPFGEFTAGLVLRPVGDRLLPLHCIYEEHYAVYFTLLTETQWRDQREEMDRQRLLRLAYEAAMVDSVTPGYQQPEVEHNLEYKFSEVVEFEGRKGRLARDGGYFGYTLKVESGAAHELILTYWGGEWAHHTFDVVVEGRTIATQVLRADRPGDFFEVGCPVPEELNINQSDIRVVLRPHSGSVAGPLYGLDLRRVD